MSDRFKQMKVMVSFFSETNSVKNLLLIENLNYNPSFVPLYVKVTHKSAREISFLHLFLCL